MQVQNTTVLKLQVVADVICPWCFIGKRSLDKAIAMLAEQGIDVELEWIPFELNPNLPPDGMDRRTFRSVRFGSWENAQAMDARAVAAGRPLGAVFNYDKQTRTSHTLAAHALLRLAWKEGGSLLQTRLVESMFAAYFTEGRDVSDHGVLETLAGSVGMAAQAVDRSTSLQGEVREREAAVQKAGVSSVPSYFMNDKPFFSGSQDPQGYVRLLTEAAAAQR
ncbi:putative DsbA family dithiol-disulfide isomerase [Luteibacter sp. OK325]|uniref:DsbA family oxidoreductase n=1 Tax=Luteibacter sp. OK325 TaxID=2135670 RepID=UPI000D3A2588|nr:DsbA family oxidoreductase [Luteibacter sp. OK325]PTR30801.1 putative DsbA family dithiol-disulfide isomerase [Luteibacter sp. OK325]